MITKYRTSSFGGEIIEPVEVERETVSSVWTKGRRSEKNTNYHQYWDTWEEAHTYLLDMSKSALESAKRELERAQNKYETISGMKAV